jgi:hypothetical protein
MLEAEMRASGNEKCVAEYRETWGDMAIVEFVGAELRVRLPGADGELGNDDDWVIGRRVR